MSKIYGPFELGSFTKGDRIEISPATDLWMQGTRYGAVLRVTGHRVHVRLDALKRTLRLPPDLIFAIIE